MILISGTSLRNLDMFNWVLHLKHYNILYINQYYFPFSSFSLNLTIFVISGTGSGFSY